MNQEENRVSQTKNEEEKKRENGGHPLLSKEGEDKWGGGGEQSCGSERRENQMLKRDWVEMNLDCISFEFEGVLSLAEFRHVGMKGFA